MKTLLHVRSVRIILDALEDLTRDELELVRHSVGKRLEEREEVSADVGRKVVIEDGKANSE